MAYANEDAGPGGNGFFLPEEKMPELAVLAVKQELIDNRFCKITDITPVKGGSKEHQYLKYEAVSLLSGETYTINNYLSPYKFCSIETLEKAIDDLKEDLVEEKYEDMKYLIKKIKETTK